MEHDGTLEMVIPKETIPAEDTTPLGDFTICFNRLINI